MLLSLFLLGDGCYRTIFFVCLSGALFQGLLLLDQLVDLIIDGFRVVGERVFGCRLARLDFFRKSLGFSRC